MRNRTAMVLLRQPKETDIGHMMMGMCKCEMTKDGMYFTCTSSDDKCCKMIQSCGESMLAMMECNCTCCLCMNNTPICCGQI